MSTGTGAIPTAWVRDSQHLSKVHIWLQILVVGIGFPILQRRHRIELMLWRSSWAGATVTHMQVSEAARQH